MISDCEQAAVGEEKASLDGSTSLVSTLTHRSLWLLRCFVPVPPLFLNLLVLLQVSEVCSRGCSASCRVVARTRSPCTACIALLGEGGGPSTGPA